MRIGKVVLTLLIALAFMGLVWVTTAAASEASLEMSESEVLVRFLLTEMHDWQYVGTAEVKSHVAPTGSTSIVSQISSGIEPTIQEKYFLKLPLSSRLHHLKEFVKFPTKKGAS